MKITIKTPCHENWNGMTPNEKGAFCLSCQKNVVDFSKKTIAEIKVFFVNIPKTESICGRFEESQLTEMTFDHFYTEFKNWKYFHKVAVIVFFIFGFTLFGNAQTHPKNQGILMGKVAYVAPDTTRPKCVKDTTTKHIKGRIKTTHEEPPRKNQVNKKRQEPPPPKLMGDVMIEENKH